jgi:hypothetical protein
MIVGGAATTFVSGLTVQVAALSITGAGTSLTLGGSLAYAGDLTQGVGTTLALGANTLTLTGTGTTLAGAVSGSGTLAFAGGSQTLDAGATITATDWTLSGGEAGTVDETLTYGGTFTEGAGTTLKIAAGDSLTLTGAASFAGTVSGAGTLTLVNAAAAFDAGADLSIAKVTEAGDGATATFGTSNLVYAGVWTQDNGALLVASDDRVNFTGTGDSFTGTLAGAGTIAFIGGSDTLTDLHVTVANPVINGATVTLSGRIVISHTMSVASDDLTIAAGGASIGGGGALVLSNSATNTVSGGTLTIVDDYIKGAGQLGNGSMGLVNDAGGIIDGDDPIALTIDTGSATITNAGRIEAGPKGLATLSSAVDNTGELIASGGTLTVEGAVSGGGKVEIDGGLADLASTFNENVAFLGAGGGTLELAHSRDYAGEISGFSRTGATALDLADIPFVSGTTTASFSGTTTSGVLTVKDGSAVAQITLEGNFTRSTFTLSSDGHGGTKVVDPPAATRFVAAMAGFGASAGEVSRQASETAHPRPMALVVPRLDAVA